MKGSYSLGVVALFIYYIFLNVTGFLSWLWFIAVGVILLRIFINLLILLIIVVQQAQANC